MQDQQAAGRVTGSNARRVERAEESSRSWWMGAERKWQGISRLEVVITVVALGAFVAMFVLAVDLRRLLE